jgi:two-component system sensor histidine kinase/response regulator
MKRTSSIQDLQVTVTKTILISSGALFLMIICNDLYLNYYFLASIKVPILIVFALAYLKLTLSGFKVRYTHFVNIPILIFFIINYLGNQGTDGPTFYGVLTLFVVYPILLTARWKWVYTGLTLVTMSILMYSGIDKNNLINAEYPDAQYQFQDHLLTFVSVSIFITILVTLVIDFYKRQNAFIESEKRKKESLLGLLAHDVRTPIYNLSQLIDLYEDESLSQKELKKLVDGMKSRITELKGTIENILSNVKAEASPATHTQTGIIPLILTQKLLANFHERMKSKKQHLLFEYEKGIQGSESLDLHSSEITIILKNLIDNACKYSKEGAEIKIFLKSRKNRILWEVEDYGVGISEEMQTRIFRESVSSENGSGIGLYLCKSIADSIGASLKFTAKRNGSIFYLEL